MFHGRVADQHKSHLSQVVGPGCDRSVSNTGKTLRNNHQNPFTEDVDGFGKVGAEMSYLQSQMYSQYDSAESIADSDLEDGELR